MKSLDTQTNRKLHIITRQLSDGVQHIPFYCTEDEYWTFIENMNEFERTTLDVFYFVAEKPE